MIFRQASNLSAMNSSAASAPPVIINGEKLHLISTAGPTDVKVPEMVLIRASLWADSGEGDGS